jgi:hypothetical protein
MLSPKYRFKKLGYSKLAQVIGNLKHGYGMG